MSALASGLIATRQLLNRLHLPQATSYLEARLFPPPGPMWPSLLVTVYNSGCLTRSLCPPAAWPVAIRARPRRRAEQWRHRPLFGASWCASRGCSSSQLEANLFTCLPPSVFPTDGAARMILRQLRHTCGGCPRAARLSSGQARTSTSNRRGNAELRESDRRHSRLPGWSWG